MSDISEPALEKAAAKVKQLVPGARVETKVSTYLPTYPERPSNQGRAPR